MADCGREGGSCFRRRSAKRRERSVRRDWRGGRGGRGGRGVFSVVGGRTISFAAPGCAGNAASSHLSNVAGKLVGGRGKILFAGVSNGKSESKVRDFVVALKYEICLVGLFSTFCWNIIFGAGRMRKKDRG